MLGVAGQLDEADRPIGFHLDGTPVALTVETPPGEPVLALVPVETDFSQPLPADWTNVDERGGAAIGTLVSPEAESRGRGSNELVGPGGAGLSSYGSDNCDYTTAIVECDDGGGATIDWSIPANAPSGLYMTRLELRDLGEAWTKGAPEIEVMVLGPDPADESDVARVVSCAGQSPRYYYPEGNRITQGLYGWRQFNQNSSVSYAKVLLLSDGQVDYFRFDDAALNSRKFEVMVVEDDSYSCGLVMDDNYYTNRAKAFIVSGYTIAASVGCLPTKSDRDKYGFACLSAGLGSVPIFLRSAWDIITTRDDDLGSSRRKDLASGFSAGPYGTHVILKSPSTSNGNMRLTYHTQTQF